LLYDGIDGAAVTDDDAAETPFALEDLKEMTEVIALEDPFTVALEDPFTVVI